MKYIHISDLHLGKRVNEFSMKEDQQYILKQIIQIVKEQKPDGIFIAGDVYDKSVASDEAVELLDGFLTRLAELNQEVFIISGNHDSATKLSFANALIEKSNIHISPAYQGSVRSYVREKDGVKVNIYLLPFVKPAMVKAAFPDEADSIKNYSDALEVAINHMEVDSKEINVLLAHQFVTGASRSESEDVTVGGLDNVAAEVFDDFNYVALGHIHGPQSVGRDTIRYCGTPLKYSFSEENQEKSVTLVEINSAEDINISTIPLKAKHDMRTVKGHFDDLISDQAREGEGLEDYLHIILTDEEEHYNALAKLRHVYPNIMKLSYDNTRTRNNKSIEDLQDVEKKSPKEIFMEFYEKQNNQPMSPEQEDYITDLLGKFFEEV